MTRRAGGTIIAHKVTKVGLRGEPGGREDKQAGPRIKNPASPSTQGEWSYGNDGGKQSESRRARMSQVVTPEEMAALVEGLRQAEDGPGSPYYHTPGETRPKGRIFSELVRIHRFQNFTAWLMELADLRLPHL